MIAPQPDDAEARLRELEHTVSLESTGHCRISHEDRVWLLAHCRALELQCSAALMSERQAVDRVAELRTENAVELGTARENYEVIYASWKGMQATDDQRQARIVDLEEKLDISSHCHFLAEEANEKLKAENAALRGDKARLDWLFAHCQVDWFPDGRMLRNREAVDAAAGESVELPVWAATQTKGGVPRSAMRARP